MQNKKQTNKETKQTSRKCHQENKRSPIGGFCYWLFRFLCISLQGRAQTLSDTTTNFAVEFLMFVETTGVNTHPECNGQTSPWEKVPL